MRNAMHIMRTICVTICKRNVVCLSSLNNIRYQISLIKEIKDVIVEKQVTFSGFVIQACRYTHSLWMTVSLTPIICYGDLSTLRSLTIGLFSE